MWVSSERVDRLEKIEKQYQTLVNALNEAPAAIVILDADGRVEFANDSMRQLVRHTPDKRLKQAIHPDDRPQYLEFQNRVWTTGNEEFIRVRHLDASGTVRWLSIHASTIGGSLTDGSGPFLAIIDDITDQVRNQAHVHQIDKRYKEILDTISDEYWETDLEGRLTFWNTAFEKKSGLTAHEIRLLKPEDYTPEADMQIYSSTMDKVQKTGHPAMMITRVFRLNPDRTDIDLITLQTSVHLKKDDSDNPVGYFGFSRDITALKETERALKESEEKFKAMSDQSLLGISIIQDDKSVYRNDTITRIFEYSHQEMNRLFDSRFLHEQIIHPDYRDFSTEQNLKKQQGILDGQVTNYQYKIFTKSGKTKWIDQYSKSISYNGRPANLITMVDITDQKNAEEELAASRHRLAAHIESTPMGVIEFDNDLNVAAWNPAAEKIFGFSRQEAVGRNVLDFLVPGYDHQKVRQVHTIKNPRANENINDNLTRDGRIITVQWFNTPIRDRRGNLVGMAATCQDITQQLKTQKLLIQSEKMISIGGLAAGMAHEINNPLGAIMQVAQNLKRRLDPDFIKNREIAAKHRVDLQNLDGYLEERGIYQFIDAILQSGKRAARIITDMLHFSRKSDTEKRPLDINRLLEKSLDLAGQDYDLKKKYDFRHIEIKREYAPSLSPVPCAETEIEQVFLNLLKNIAQAIKEPDLDRKPLITLRTAMEKDMVRVEIEDNGPGMEESVRSRIFEPFFTTKPVGEGTGLGLSVSYSIITGNHLGTMEVESEAGKGTRFIIRLPLDDTAGG